MSTDPNELGFSRIPGMQEISIVEFFNVATVPDIWFGTHKITEAVVLESGAAWMEDFYFTPFTANYKEKENLANGTNTFDVTVECFYPKHDADSVYFLTQLERKRFIIDCIDKDGNRRLVGTKEQPLEFVQTYETGSKPGDKKGHALVFAANLGNRPPFYAPP